MTNLLELPLELLTHTLSYVSLTERAGLSLICRSFYSAFIQSLTSTELITLSNQKLSTFALCHGHADSIIINHACLLKKLNLSAHFTVVSHEIDTLKKNHLEHIFYESFFLFHNSYKMRPGDYRTLNDLLSIAMEERSERLAIALTMVPFYSKESIINRKETAIQYHLNLLLKKIIAQIKDEANKIQCSLAKENFLKNHFNEILLIAARHGNLKACQIALNEPITDINCIDCLELSPLMHAVMKNHVHIVKFLIDDENTNINQISKQASIKIQGTYYKSETALNFSIGLSLPEITDMLLNHSRLSLSSYTQALFTCRCLGKAAAEKMAYNAIFNHIRVDEICEKIDLWEEKDRDILTFIIDHPQSPHQFKMRYCNFIFKFSKNVDCIHIATNYIITCVQDFIEKQPKKFSVFNESKMLKEARYLLKKLKNENHVEEITFNYKHYIQEDNPLRELAESAGLLFYYARKKINLPESKTPSFIKTI